MKRPFNQLRIPGDPRGKAVLSEDPEEGPLAEEEVIALLAALRSDLAIDVLSLQQRCALWLCFALGRNPANYCLLQEHDLITIKVDGVDTTAYELMVPCIKKRGVGEREQFKRQKLTPEIAQLIQQLIAENGSERPVPIGTPKWFFRRATPHEHRMNSDNGEFSYSMYSNEFTFMIVAAVKKLESNRPLQTNPSRSPLEDFGTPMRRG